MHHMPPLPHDFREGVPGLLSAEGFDMAWTQHMTLMLDKLNAMTAGTFWNLSSIAGLRRELERATALGPIGPLMPIVSSHGENST